MALEVYFTENVQRILDSVSTAGGCTAAIVNEEIEKAAQKTDTTEMADHLRIYRRGYTDAVVAVAKAFGITHL